MTCSYLETQAWNE